MGAEDSVKKLRRMKNTKKRREIDSEIGVSQLAQEEGKLYRANKEDRKNKKKKKNSSIDVTKEVEGEMFGSPGTIDETRESSGGNRKSKKLRKDKRKKGNVMSAAVEELDNQHTNGDEDRISGKGDMESEPAGHTLLKSRKKERKNGESVNKIGEFHDKDDASEHQSAGKSKKHGKMKRKSQVVKEKASPDNGNLLEKSEDNEEDDVYQMSSGDEDYSKGMQKWVTQYHQSRPGLKVLQERIDEFITAHEAKEEQSRVEREAQAAEGGWTVVVHHKGRKKTTDAESGVAVGSVAAAAVLDKMAKKKKKDVGVDFYRFQKREAHRNEIMMLQSKFEQDKKRIQQMRAARKFRPY